MKKPRTIQFLYLDFDGFFAGIEEQCRSGIQGKPIGVVPFANAHNTCVIAANYKAKQFGVKTGTLVSKAKFLCPDIQLIPQNPELYVRAHEKLKLIIESEIPIYGVCSIDELTCKLQSKDIEDPFGLSNRIKTQILRQIGPYITCSIGMAPNIQLAKIASDMDKPNGLTIITPEELPGRLLQLQIDDIPGIGGRMKKRLIDAGIFTVEGLWNAQPKQLKALWGNIHGERFWYALHGYQIETDSTQKSMFGHGRVLPPDMRDAVKAKDIARTLTIKAARRLRKEDFNARKFGLWLKLYDDYGHDSWSGEHYVSEANDDYSALRALDLLWKRAADVIPATYKIIQVHVALYELRPASARQTDFFDNNVQQREKWQSVSHAIDAVNSKYARTVLSLGKWPNNLNDYTGGKIAFSRIPDMEDFW